MISYSSYQIKFVSFIFFFFYLLLEFLIPNSGLHFQVMQFVESQEYNMFSRIVFDTAPTVRTPDYCFLLALFLRAMIDFFLAYIVLVCGIYLTQFRFLSFVRVTLFDFCPCLTSWTHPLARYWRCESPVKPQLLLYVWNLQEQFASSVYKPDTPHYDLLLIRRELCWLLFFFFPGCIASLKRNCLSFYSSLLKALKLKFTVWCYVEAAPSWLFFSFAFSTHMLVLDESCRQGFLKHQPRILGLIIISVGRVWLIKVLEWLRFFIAIGCTSLFSKGCTLLFSEVVMFV